jgi:hypothetical protein
VTVIECIHAGAGSSADNQRWVSLGVSLGMLAWHALTERAAELRPCTPMDDVLKELESCKAQTFAARIYHH